MRKTIITVRVTPEQKEWLDYEATMHADSSIAHIIRLVLDEKIKADKDYLAKKGKGQ